MANTNTPASINLEDAPGGDLDLDAIFGGSSETQEPVPAAAAETPVNPSESANTEFLRNASGTVVYKTAEDAIKGIEHKDALISELREKLARQTGSDPLKERQENRPVSYVEDAEAYFKDIAEAKNKEELVRIQQKLINDTIAPYAPVISNMARTQAVAKTAEEIPDFVKFQNSDEYRQTLEQYPLIKTSIEIAEQNPHMVQDLVQLYRMAHDIASSKTLSQALKERQEVAKTQTTQTAPVRPTVSSTPVAPPISGTRTATPSLRTPEGRKAIIQMYEEKGIADLPL